MSATHNNWQTRGFLLPRKFTKALAPFSSHSSVWWQTWTLGELHCERSSQHFDRKTTNKNAKQLTEKLVTETYIKKYIQLNIWPPTFLKSCKTYELSQSFIVDYKFICDWIICLIRTKKTHQITILIGICYLTLTFKLPNTICLFYATYFRCVKKSHIVSVSLV